MRWLCIEIGAAEFIGATVPQSRVEYAETIGSATEFRIAETAYLLTRFHWTLPENLPTAIRFGFGKDKFFIRALTLS